ncbi:MAG: hypothetical protein CVV64_17665 [Candidatus Wallbacteria bacterium HGW-Wallbacteria-1]|jgi:RNA polymerase-binding transcription factor DksA|uniref:Uncharacterized protein n=1 Tax=Candidatus Wallbacteria bacterium HGW-Wallbacteria-1 TaxID=2013854 RepID=A0A2N1PK16_9BACT|nr:MAG: hypothetical protein CVV64_17665 [Candidatus Wallbacteria bacterium HGW-Wallbacteria-1]
MAFFQEEAGCPWCGATTYTVSLSVNDMPLSDDPNEPEEQLLLNCTGCGRRLFQTAKTQGGKVSARGIGICRSCDGGISATTHPAGVDTCKTCGAKLEIRWWRERGFVV